MAGLGPEAVGDELLEHVDVQIFVDDQGLFVVEMKDGGKEMTHTPQIDIPIGWTVSRIKRFILDTFTREVRHRLRAEPNPNNWELIFVDSTRSKVLDDDKNLRAQNIAGEGSLTIEGCLTSPHSRLELKTPRLTDGIQPLEPRPNFSGLNLRRPNT